MHSQEVRTVEDTITATMALMMAARPSYDSGNFWHWRNQAKLALSQIGKTYLALDKERKMAMDRGNYDFSMKLRHQQSELLGLKRDLEKWLEVPPRIGHPTLLANIVFLSYSIWVFAGTISNQGGKLYTEDIVSFLVNMMMLWGIYSAVKNRKIFARHGLFVQALISMPIYIGISLIIRHYSG